MSSPERVQLSRAKGWRKPPNTVVVARPSRWGSPYPLSEYEVDYSDEFGFTDEQRRAMSVSDFRGLVEGRWERLDGTPAYPSRDEIVGALSGKNLACWCPLDQPCHADVLLELANQSIAPASDQEADRGGA